MLEQYFRSPYQYYLTDPLVRWLSQHPSIQAWHVTLFSGITGILAGWAIAMGFPWLAVILLLVSGHADTVDGSLARQHHHATSFGAVIDIVTDRLVEGAIVLGLYGYAPMQRGGYCLLMLVSILLCVTTFLVVGVFIENNSQKGFHYSAGLMERAEAFLFFMAMIVLPSAFAPLAVVFSVLVGYTAVRRVLEFYQAENSLKNI